VSIGPETTRAARAAGIDVVAEAETHDLDGLVEAVRAVSL
jgi:uroporphyrinogen-III synthase